MSHLPDEVTFKAWLWEARRELESAGIESPHLSAQLILEHITGESRSMILAHPERLLDESQRRRATDLLNHRLNHVPMAYLLGWKDFRNLRLRVTPDVLIPRPETEELIDLAVSLAPRAGRILDAGTGSGCIPLSLSEIFPQALLFGSDLSHSALQCARGNDPSGRVIWIQASWLEPIGSRSLDLAVSNPPYLTTSEMTTLEPQVGLYEPHLALDGGVDGCDCYRSLIPQAMRALKSGGVLLLECSPATIVVVISLLQGAGFTEVHAHTDFAGRDRFVSATRG
jgi:release factor glutamine methyltransferase